MHILQSWRTGMSKTVVLDTVRKTNKRIWSSNWIKIVKTITSHEWNHRLRVIDRKAKGIKRNINIIVISELFHGNQIFNSLCFQNPELEYLICYQQTVSDLSYSNKNKTRDYLVTLLCGMRYLFPCTMCSSGGMRGMMCIATEMLVGACEVAAT